MMEAAPASEAQLLITGPAGDQPLIMSAEDAAQFLAQAGLQLADIGDSERIIIGDAGHSHQEVKITHSTDPRATVAASSLLSSSLTTTRPTQSKLDSSVSSGQ
jgi:hypothetical protein